MIFHDRGEWAAASTADVTTRQRMTWSVSHGRGPGRPPESRKDPLEYVTQSSARGHGHRRPASSPLSVTTSSSAPGIPGPPSPAPKPTGMGNPPFAQWHADHAQVRLETFEEAAAFGETVVNTTAGERSHEDRPGRRRPGGDRRHHCGPPRRPLTADLGVALASLPEQLEQGFTTFSARTEPGHRSPARCRSAQPRGDAARARGGAGLGPGARGDSVRGDEFRPGRESAPETVVETVRPDITEES